MKIILTILLSLSVSCAHQKPLSDSYAHSFSEQMMPNGTWDVDMYSAVPCYDVVEEARPECVYLYKGFVQKYANNLCPSNVGKLFGCSTPRAPILPNLEPSALAMNCYVKCE